ncbi:PAS domain S-box protein [Dendrosporobacter sp. 1207_IL3150]|uniref:PAS domain S-box protein n=1 Tax=Dendrosporobacter sp. 1207_IL3150 TaxID=3084054 RepID=UPI002FD9DED6
MSPSLSATKKVYFMITLITAIAFVGISYNDAIKTKYIVYADKERTLIQIATTLAQRLDKTYSEIIQEENGINLSPEERRSILKKRLQPIINEIEQKYPGYLMVFGDYEHLIAASANFKLVPTVAGKAVYEKKEMISAINNYSPVWGTSSMSVNYPLISNDEIYGHVGVSTKLADVEAAYWDAWKKNLLIYLVLWLNIMFALRKLFEKFNSNLENLANQIKNQDDSKQGLCDFPELEPVLETVINLRTELRKKSAEIERILENVSDMFYSLDKDLMFTYCNEATKNHFRVDLTGRHLLDCTANPNPFIIHTIQEAAHKKEPVYFEAISSVNNRWFSFNLYPKKDGGVSVFFRDINELKINSEKLRQAQERFQKSFHMNPNMMMIVSEKGVYIDVNEVFLKTTGLKREEVIGATTAEINLSISPKQLNEIANILKEDGHISNYELEFLEHNQKRIGLLSADVIEINSEICRLNVITDITEKKLLENELAKYDSLSLLSQFCGAVGHEIRNPMTTVRGYLQLFQRKKQFNDYHEDIATMIEELDRANSIISEFLSLAKSQKAELKSTDLNAVINTLFPLMQADAFRMGHNIRKDLEKIPNILLDDKEIR